MAEYAYIDEARKTMIYPEDALVGKNADHYFCPNPECGAWLRAVRSDEIKHPNPFFRALPTHKHIEGCNFKAYYDEDAQNNRIHQNNIGLHEDDFLIDKLYEKVMSDTNETDKDDGEGRISNDKSDNKRESLISSTKKLARFCISHDIEENLGDSPIYDFLIDSRTVYKRYRQFINVESGNKVFLLLLPLSRMNYEKDKARVFLSLKERFKDVANVDFRFEIKFEKTEVFWAFINEAFQYSATKSNIAILTKMIKYYGNDNYYICSIVNEGQYWLRIDNAMA